MYNILKWLALLVLSSGGCHGGDAMWQAGLGIDAMDAVDATKSPCDNFHEYACGNWYVSYQLRSLGAHDRRTQLRALNKQLLVQHFEASGAAEEHQKQQQQQQQQQLNSFYNSCMSGRQSLHVYMDALVQQAPNWPLLNNATKQFDWARGNAAVRRLGADGLWRLLVQPNWQSGEQNVFYLLPPSFELLGSSEESEFLYQRYLKYLLLELGLRVRRAAALATRLVSFECSLKELLPATMATRHVLHEPQTLQQLSQQLPQLQLNEYFRQLLGDKYTLQLMLVADTAYLVAMEQLLHSADPLVVSTWLLLQLPAHFELHLHEDTTLSVQREHCLQQLNSLLPQQLTQLLLRLQHGSNAAAATYLERQQQQMRQLFDTIKLQFERLLNATPIFEQDAATQTLALQKLHAMRLLMPPGILPKQEEVQQQQQHQQQQQQQQQPEQSYDTYLLNLSEAQAVAQFQSALDCLQLPCGISGSWTDNGPNALGALDVNVYYRLKLNAIELPLGLLRPPLMPTRLGEGGGGGGGAALDELDQEAAARLLGGLGYMLGHELIHGFDYDGINYDDGGHIAGGQWPPRAIIRFGLRAGCYLGARYSNATLTINENIADSEGLRLAYEALRQWQQQQQQQQSTNHNNANESLTAAMRSFFVAFAQNWCGSNVAARSSSKVQQQQQQPQQHASHQERVNNVLGNFPEFAETFECKAGSMMHPPDKCRIW